MEHSQPGWVQQPVASSVPNCPAGNVDCGYCKCVPAGTCGSCLSFGSRVLQPVLAPHLVEENSTVVTETENSQPGFVAQPRKSAVPNCPAAFADCAMCQCTPNSACSGCYDYAKYMPHLVQKTNASSSSSAKEDSHEGVGSVMEHSQPGW